ncbi:excalibur calcium-binding domain-containing protein [Corynebacterium sp. A21]|uniref:excalibur calcium-binding domain-containing protein n=1 Tax=Corynebacterium sp. A21 TaxID=3457318 RepID=UPI003FCEEF3F
MRKTLLALTVAASVIISTVVPAAAQTQELDSGNPAETSLSAELSSGSSESTEGDLGDEDEDAAALSSGSSAGSSENTEDSVGSEGEIGAVIIGVAAIAAVAGLVGAGVTWAVQERLIANPLPGIIPSPAPVVHNPAPAPAPTPAPVVNRPAPAPVPAPAPAPVVNRPAPAPAPAPVVNQRRVPPAGSYFKNCTAVRAAGYAPIYRGEPGYRSALDRDNDGVACE